MRELTFKGYLLSQLRELSGLNSTSLYAFSQLACNNARLKDTLTLYLVMYTEENLRSKLLKKFDYLNSSCEKLNGLNDDNAETYLQNDSLSEYKTVYNNFLYQRNRKEQEDKLKMMMYNKISEVKQAKRVTNYRIYRELNLNPGNVNAFLKNEDTSKVSVDTARKILTFVNNY
ncbi:MAG: hypothetical protein ACI4G1_07825 [Ruminococcus sp.]